MKIEIDALSKEEGRVKANMGDAASKKAFKSFDKTGSNTKIHARDWYTIISRAMEDFVLGKCVGKYQTGDKC